MLQNIVTSLMNSPLSVNQLEGPLSPISYVCLLLAVKVLILSPSCLPIGPYIACAYDQYNDDTWHENTWIMTVIIIITVEGGTGSIYH